ncbi:hypothetical protein [Winogradskyella sp. PE311]|uniref:hypothetical protein n=1 Tax=Winogradskyella sp. PE311 TaxID=3366943 RepID=UPI00397F8CFE
MRQTVDVGMKLVEGQRLQNAILRAAGNYIPTRKYNLLFNNTRIQLNLLLDIEN